jgi:hypothetical protein
MSRDTTQSRRALITFATVSDALERSNDFLLGIAPLFGPLAEECSGQIFQAEKFTSDVKAKFGLAIPGEVASFLAPRLERAGLLETRNIGPHEKAFFWKPVAEQSSAPRPDIEEKIDEIIALFVEFVGSLDTAIIRRYAPEELEDITYDFLINQDKLLSSAQSALLGLSEVSTELKFSSEKEYISGRFMQWLSERHPHLSPS